MTSTEFSLEDFYRKMLLIRAVEESFLELYSKGQIKGTVHTCIGQEACAVGVLSALDCDKDVVFSNHRAHGHYIAYGAPLRELIAEIFGLESGICKGIGGTQHLHYRNFYTNGIQGGIVPVAAGAALAEKLSGSGAITAVFLGEGTLGEGVVYEVFNLSALWNLPLLFVFENNQYAQSTSLAASHAGDIFSRASSFGIKSTVVDGNDVEAVFSSACQAALEVRTTNRPHFLCLKTYRIGPHSKGDDTRPIEEIEHHRKNDPLSKLSSVFSTEIEAVTRQEVEMLFQSVLEEAAANEVL